MTSRSGHRAAGASREKPSATDLVNTEAMPNAVPAAAASSTPRSTTRRVRCATRRSAATRATVTGNSRLRSPAANVRPASRSPPVSASSPARPTVASTAPRQAAAPARRRTNTAAIGSAKTMVSAPSGCTRLSGPYLRASTWRAAPRPLRTTAAHQTGRWSGAYRRSGEPAATRSWTIAPPAYATAETRQRRTDSASALMKSTMPHPAGLFLPRRRPRPTPARGPGRPVPAFRRVTRARAP